MSPFIIVIFGATGDLAQHKLIPALFELYKKGSFGDKFYIVGLARRDMTDIEYARFLGEELGRFNDPMWRKFAKNIYYHQGLFEEKGRYLDLVERLNGFDKEIGACITRLFYLATPPDNYLSILENLKSSKLSNGCGVEFEKAIRKDKSTVGKWVRVAIEKPFGKDLETAKELDRKLGDIFAEEQIYRVDHYLAKETVQNMIAFRFANSIFEPVWNKEYVDHVQITFKDEGVGKRGKFFDGVGMLRDVGQNHLIQLLATVAMEQPKSFTKEGIRDARASAIKAIRKIEPSEVGKFVVRGQYAGYRNEPGVAPNSLTETYVAMKLFVDTKRFEEVPFYLRVGKNLTNEKMKIKIVFKQTCHMLFKEYGCPEIGNVLTIKIQPDEGIKMQVIAKTPGSKIELGTVDMSFSYHQAFGGHGGDAYEKLLMDIFQGDQMLFNRSDELESSWGLITEILKGWKVLGEKAKLHIYKKGSWGPIAARDLIEKDGRKWI